MGQKRHSSDEIISKLRQADISAGRSVRRLLCSAQRTYATDGYTSCPLITGYDSMVLAEFGYDKQPMETFPFDQSKERFSMFLLKKFGLPNLYWHGMLKGRA